LKTKGQDASIAIFSYGIFTLIFIRTNSHSWSVSNISVSESSQADSWSRRAPPQVSPS
jgi:hypothetical protein